MSLIQIKGKAVLIQQSKKKLTDGEIALLALIKNKLKNNLSITREDFVKIYQKRVQRYAQKDGLYDYDSENNRFIYKPRDYLKSEIELQAYQWFVSALGRLIIKAKLIVIPVIDIES